MLPQIQEAVGILRQVTYSADGSILIAKLDQGEVELQFSCRRQNDLRTKLRRYVGSKIGILWFNATNGDQIVKIRQLEKPTLSQGLLNDEPLKAYRKTKASRNHSRHHS